MTGIVRRKLKVTKVIPVFKTGSRSCINNYRPIFLLAVFDKERKILYFKQFGFRNSYSTSYALLTIVDKIKHAIDNHDYGCGVFLDLSKAFDIVNHDILIKKLEFYGTRGHANKWFLSYLTCKRQFVSIKVLINPK